MCIGSATAFAEPMDAGKAFTKLTRGGVNLLTGWVELPKRIQETSQSSGSAAGFTWGLLRGLGHGFIRTAAGLYELVTFPFPAPPDYQSIIQPEYVFSVETSTNY
jgi:putative exosortase-associated protein (TIGR04073 family)